MDRIKPYNNTENRPSAVSEPAICYEISCGVDEFIASLPADMMGQLVEKAVSECKSGRGIAHEKMNSYISERMGW